MIRWEKKKIGYLPELNALYYDMYVREYLGFYCRSSSNSEAAETSKLKI